MPHPYGEPLTVLTDCRTLPGTTPAHDAVRAAAEGLLFNRTHVRAHNVHSIIPGTGTGTGGEAEGEAGVEAGKAGGAGGAVVITVIFELGMEAHLADAVRNRPGI